MAARPSLPVKTPRAMDDTSNLHYTSPRLSLPPPPPPGEGVHTQPFFTAVLSSDDLEEEEEEEDLACGFRKVKMFQMPPSDNPELEERRQRAVYAKQNRDIKKREVVKLQHEVAALHSTLEKCQMNMTHMHNHIQSQQCKIEKLKQGLSDTSRQLRVKEEQVRNGQEKMSLLKAHLEVITHSLEENDISRRMLLSLLAQS